MADVCSAPSAGALDCSAARSPTIRETSTALALTVASPLCLLDVEERCKSVVTANDHQVSTRLPGPCLLWHSGAAEDETYREPADQACRHARGDIDVDCWPRRRGLRGVRRMP